MAAKSGSRTIEDVLGSGGGLTIEQALAGADPHGEIEAAVRNAGSLTTNDANPYSPGLGESAAGAVEFTKEPGRFLLRRVPMMIGAMAGNAIGGKVMEKIPALAGIGWKQALGRIGLLSASEGAGAGAGDITGQFLAGDEIDPEKAGLTAAIQAGLGVANSGTAASMGKGGAVSDAAIEGAMGRPGFAKAPAPGEYVKVVRDIHAGFEPTSPGRVDLEGSIQSFDNQNMHIEGGRLVDAMERGLPSGSAAENIAARDKLIGEIANHRAEIARLAQQHQIDPMRVLGAPAVDIPGGTTVTPPETIGVGAPAAVIPGGKRITPGVNILPTHETAIPQDLRGAVGEALGRSPRSGTANMRYPLTGRQADTFIRKNLTAPIAEDMAGNPGATEYVGGRKALRGRVAGEFYDQLGIGASESATRAKEVLDVKDLVADKYFPLDERGVPKPASAGRISAVGRNNTPEDAVYREHLQSIDKALGADFTSIADGLSQKQEWAPNDQRDAAFLLDAYRASSGRIVTTGGFRGFLRWIGRTALRSQGKTGAMLRAAATGDIAERIRPDREKRRIGPTP